MWRYNDATMINTFKTDLATQPRGVCIACGCSEFDPCLLTTNPFGPPTPCSWANREQTLCTNPECLVQAQECGICGLMNGDHTDLMKAACVMRSFAIATAMGAAQA